MTDTTSLIPVPLGACRCPGKPHGDGDFVYLDPVLNSVAGLAASSVAAADGVTNNAQRTALMLQSAAELSVRDWTLERANGDGKNTKIPITPEEVKDRLTWDNGGAEMLGKAAVLYGKSIFAPFREAQKKRQETTNSSPTGQTESSSTSAPTSIRRKRRSASA